MNHAVILFIWKINMIKRGVYGCHVDKGQPLVVLFCIKEELYFQNSLHFSSQKKFCDILKVEVKERSSCSQGWCRYRGPGTFAANAHCG